jgi:hypothetical protein
MVTWVIRTEAEAEAFKKIFEDSDRGAAIVAASFVEEFLKQQILYLLRTDTAAKNVISKAFGSNGLLANFSNKIDLGFLLRLYGKKALAELDTIRRLRNDFAHNLEYQSFDTQSIATRCRNLTLVDGYFNPISERPRLRQIPGMHYYEDDGASTKAYLEKPRNRFLETCGIFVATFGYGNYPIVLPIYGDDRQAWPQIAWEILIHSRYN